MTKSIKSEDRVKLAIQQMLFEHPFYANIILQLKVVADVKIPTFGVSIDTLTYNPKFADQLTMQTIKVILIHEVLHLVFKHHLRQKVYGSKQFSHTSWNIAGDLAINSLIMHMAGFPKNALVPGRADYANLPVKKSAEWYLNNLPKPEDQDDDESDDSQDDGESDDSQDDGESDDSQDDSQDESQDESQDDGESDGESDDSQDESQDDGESDKGEASGESDGESGEPNMSGDPADPFGEVHTTEVTEEELAEAKEDMAEIISRAIDSTKSQGAEVPAALKEVINDITIGPKLDWKIIMRQFMNSTKTATLNWRTPSRRLKSGNLIFPSRHKRDMPKALFIADTSGSMGRKDIELCLAEIFEAKDVVGEVDLLQFDTSVRAVSALDMNTNPKDVRIIGGGGTRFKSVVNWLETKGKTENYRAVFVLSDMYLEKNDWTAELKNISQNIMWLSTTKEITMAPGRTLYIGE